uniref:Proline-rich transmembrane protein 3/4 domain-containing protein n=1 Tax=Rhodnius prolixus TaxID=13249 RepID=T1HV60_RHOPR
MSTINVFLCILGSSRAICLFIDAYALRDVMPSLMGGVLWDVAVPSLLSVLALLQLAVLRVSQLSGRPRFLLTSSAISIAITIHFTSVLAVDLSLALHSNMLTVKYIIETVFHVWGLFLCITFLYTAHRAREVLRNMPSAVLERDIDVQYKGIMQLTMLAPYNNLATSVAAALVPTLLAPKLMHKKPLQDDEPKNLVDSRERRGNKKLSWGPEKRISGQTQRKIQQTTSARRRAEEETEDANTSLLPPHNKLQTDLTLDTILNHIAYMNRGGVSQTSQTRKKSLQQVLTLATMAPLLSMGLLLVGLFRLYTPPEWYTQCCGWWLWFETACRALELVVAWCAANLTKQPLSNSGLYHRTGGAGGGEAKTRQSMFM